MISKISTSEFLASSCHRCSFYSRTRLVARVFCFRSLCASCEVRGSKTRAASRIDRCLAHAHSLQLQRHRVLPHLTSLMPPSCHQEDLCCRIIVQRWRDPADPAARHSIFSIIQNFPLFFNDSFLFILKTNLHEAFSTNHNFYRSFSVGFHFFAVDLRISIVNQ